MHAYTLYCPHACAHPLKLALKQLVGVYVHVCVCVCVYKFVNAFLSDREFAALESAADLDADGGIDEVLKNKCLALLVQEHKF
jgi:hypothetical protein